MHKIYEDSITVSTDGAAMFEHYFNHHYEDDYYGKDEYEEDRGDSDADIVCYCSDYLCPCPGLKRYNKYI